jgi:hypothetical protein
MEGEIQGREGTGGGKPPSRAWRAGLWIFTLIFLYRGAVILLALVHGNRFHPATASLAAAYLACGACLALSRNWGRVLVLVCLPVMALHALFAIGITPTLRHTMAYSMLAVYGALFIYLFLPPVERLFPRPPRRKKPRDFLAPPPRKVPFSLKLATLFGNRFMLMCWMFTAFMFFGTGNKLKEEGLSAGPGMSWHVILAWSLTWLVYFGVLLYMTRKLAGWILAQDFRLLEQGLLAQATLKSKTEIHLKHTLYRLVFTYRINGMTYHTSMDTTDPKRLLDDRQEPVLCDPLKPRHSILLDDLPAHIDIDGQGNLVHRHSFMGYVYALVPAAVLAGMVYWTFS